MIKHDKTSAVRGKWYPLLRDVKQLVFHPSPETCPSLRPPLQPRRRAAPGSHSSHWLLFSKEKRPGMQSWQASAADPVTVVTVLCQNQRKDPKKDPKKKKKIIFVRHLSSSMAVLTSPLRPFWVVKSPSLCGYLGLANPRVFVMICGPFPTSCCQRIAKLVCN